MLEPANVAVGNQGEKTSNYGTIEHGNVKTKLLLFFNWRGNLYTESNEISVP
jgi:hypothetical protein